MRKGLVLDANFQTDVRRRERAQSEEECLEPGGGVRENLGLILGGGELCL